MPKRACSQRLLDWSQLKFGLVWGYSGRPTQEELYSPETSITVWRVTRGRISVATSTGRFSASPNDWVFQSGAPREPLFSNDAELVSVRLMAVWPHGKGLFPRYESKVMCGSLAERLRLPTDDLVAFAQNHLRGERGLEEAPTDLLTFLALNSRVASWLGVVADVAMSFGLVANRIGVVDARVLTARRYLDTAPLESRLAIDPLLRATGLSRKQLDRLVAAETGSSLQGYFEARRLQFGLMALRCLPLSIKEISGKLGFTEPAAFTHWIRRNTGQAPTDWRRSGGLQHAEPLRLHPVPEPFGAVCA